MGFWASLDRFLRGNNLLPPPGLKTQTIKPVANQYNIWFLPTMFTERWWELFCWAQRYVTCNRDTIHSAQNYAGEIKRHHILEDFHLALF
jgi:hypothetical protein